MTNSMTTVQYKQLDLIAVDLINASDNIYDANIALLRTDLQDKNTLDECILRLSNAKENLRKEIECFDHFNKNANDIDSDGYGIVSRLVDSLRKHL